jgi:hypothetical protein
MKKDDAEVKEEGFSIIYEEKLAGFITDVVVDHRKHWSGESGFVVECGPAC